MENKKRITAKLFIYLSNIALPLLLGLVIYILYKPQALIVKWINALFSFEAVKGIYSNLNPIQLLLRNYFCDMCWSYAFTFSVATVIGYSKSGLICAVIINAVLSVFIETVQFIGIADGTADIADVVLQVISGVIAAIIITLIFRRKNK